MIKVDNYIINEPIINIINHLKTILTNGKLTDIRVGSTDITITCPDDLHDGGHEKNPDCHINIDENNRNVSVGYFHCFACGSAGDFVKFVSLCFSSTLDFAKNWLITNYGIPSDEAIIIDEPIELKTETKYLDESILDQYQKWCPYLAKRKLNRDICEKFKVRYDPYYRQVIFPIRDIHGNLKMLAKRSIDTKFFYMDKDQEKEVYGLNIIQKNNIKSAIITEGPFDMLTGWSYGEPTIATLGNISNYQIKQINNSCLNVLYTMFDNDEAGKKFTELIKAKVSKRILVEEIKIPNGYKDLNDLDYETFKNIFENR